MPKAPNSSADDTKKYHCDCERLCKGQLREVPYGTWRRHAGFRGPDTKGTRSLKEKRTHAGMASSAVQRASQGRSTGGTSDIRRSLSLDQDPQLVQQDEQDDDPNLEENHLADYDDFGNIPNTAPDVHPPISPPRQ